MTSYLYLLRSATKKGNASQVFSALLQTCVSRAETVEKPKSNQTNVFSVWALTVASAKRSNGFNCQWFRAVWGQSSANPESDFNSAHTMLRLSLFTSSALYQLKKATPAEKDFGTGFHASKPPCCNDARRTTPLWEAMPTRILLSRIMLSIQRPIRASGVPALVSADCL